jgi:serine/threonine protein kinase/tetratricopeptide (TPR) repeat protein
MVATGAAALKTERVALLWMRSKELLLLALDRPRDQRAMFVRSECGADEELLNKVLGLLEAHDRSNSPVDVPALELRQWVQGLESQPAVFASGQEIGGRFEILRCIAQGGMGEVYEAFDRELGERVALKTIRPEIATDPSVIERFRREVQRSRRITHPNVCRVHDLFSYEGGGNLPIRFLTMELLEGESLSDRLKREGRMSTAQAVPIISQIAGALDCAHAMNIIHRDLKPGNIILQDSSGGADGGCRAVVTDFGLARHIEKPSGGNTTSEIIGTLAYMSPEQLQGKPASPASDIYAFGIVIYQMCTGMMPFEGDTPMAVAIQRLTRSPIPPSKYVQGLDPAWESAILRCLDPNAQARPSGAREVVTALSGAPHAAGSTAVNLDQPTEMRSRFNRRNLLGIAALPIMSGGAWWIYSHRPLHLRQGSQLLLTDIRNLTPEADLAGVTELFRQQLGQSALFNLVETDAVQQMLFTMTLQNTTDLSSASGEEVAWRLKAQAVLFGAVARVGADYVITLELQIVGSEPHSPRRRTVNSFIASNRSGLLEAIQQAARWVRATVGESDREISVLDSIPDEVTTPSWRALADVARSEALKRTGRNEEALAELRAALLEDPDFTLASARAGDILCSIGRQREGLRMYNAAIQSMRRRRITTREEMRIRGLVAVDSGDMAEADRQFEHWAAMYPNDPRPLHYRYYPLLMMGRAPEAVYCIRKAIDMNYRLPIVVGALAICYNFTGNIREAQRAIEQVRFTGDSDRANDLEGVVHATAGQLTEARSFFERMQSSQDASTKLRGFLFDALTLCELGDYRQASRVADQMLSPPQNDEVGSSLAQLFVVRAWLACAMGDHATARGSISRAISLQPGPEILAMAATTLATHGLNIPGEIGVAINRFTGVSAEVAGLRVTGEDALARSDMVVAMEVLRRASELEPALAWREYYARALETAGKLQEALYLYNRMVGTPAVMWLNRLASPPGAWRNAVVRSLELSKKTGTALTSDVVRASHQLSIKTSS